MERMPASWYEVLYCFAFESVSKSVGRAVFAGEVLHRVWLLLRGMHVFCTMLFVYVNGVRQRDMVDTCSAAGSADAEIIGVKSWADCSLTVDCRPWCGCAGLLTSAGVIFAQ